MREPRLLGHGFTDASQGVDGTIKVGGLQPRVVQGQGNSIVIATKHGFDAKEL